MRFRISALLICLAVVVSPYISSAAEEEGKTVFFRELLRKPQATVEDAVHATARYKGYEGQTGIPAEIEFLSQRGIRFQTGSRASPILSILSNPLDKGSATFLLMKALGVKGGVMYRLFPNSQRYSLREAADMGFLPATSVVSEKMSGADLLGLLVKIVEYTGKKSQQADEP